MKLTDILPVEQWIELEKEIYARSGLYPFIYDADGVNITGTNRHNPLCLEILKTPQGRERICLPSYRDIAREAQRSYKPVIGVCRSGQVKIVVPIHMGVTFIGSAGGCGLLQENRGLEDWYVSKTLGMNVKRLEDLAKGIPSISHKKALDVANYTKARIDGIIAIYMLMRASDNQLTP